MEALHERVKEMRVHETISEWAPKYDPSSNGAAEEAVKEVEGKARTLMLALCDRIQEEISIEHPIIESLVQYSAELRECAGRCPLLSRRRMRLEVDVLQHWS